MMATLAFNELKHVFQAKQFPMTIKFNCSRSSTFLKLFLSTVIKQRLGSELLSFSVITQKMILSPGFYKVFPWYNPVHKYMLKVNNANTRKRCESYMLKVKNKDIKTPFDIVLLSLLLTLNIFHTFF